MGIHRSNDPTTWDDVDGIIVDESAPAPSVVGVAANVAILVGQTQRGPRGLTGLGGTGQFHEIYGKSNFGVNRELKNKKFGRLKLIRVVAANAAVAQKPFQSSAVDRITFKAKQGEGLYGNSLRVKIEEGSSSRQEKHTVLCVADVADSLDAKYFILRDEAGTVAFWIDVDNDGAVEPAHGADRSVEITTIATGDSAAVVAGKVAAAIEADLKFTASVQGATVTATCLAFAPGVGAAANGNSGFTVTRTQLGVYAGKKYTFIDANPDAVLPAETKDNVKIGEISAGTFASSRLLVATVNSAAAEPSNCDFTSLEGGSDGVVGDSDYEAAIELAGVERAGNVVFLDQYNAVRNGFLKQHAANFPDKMVILAPGENDTKSQVLEDVANFRDTEGRIMYAFPWLQTTINGVSEMTSPASWVASIFSQTAPQIDMAYVKNSQFLAGVTGMKFSLNRNDYIELKDAGVMAFERDEDFGFKIKSGITTQIADSSKVLVLRRRMTDFLTDSIARFLKNYQNAVNFKGNWVLVKGAILSFIKGLENDGILPKDSEVETGLAKLVDVESLNTGSSVAAGFFKILYKQRIHSSMRFIVLQAEIGESVTVTEAA